MQSHTNDELEYDISNILKRNKDKPIETKNKKINSYCTKFALEMSYYNDYHDWFWSDENDYYDDYDRYDNEEWSDRMYKTAYSNCKMIGDELMKK